MTWLCKFQTVTSLAVKLASYILDYNQKRIWHFDSNNHNFGKETTKIHKDNIIFIYSVNKKRQCNKIYDIFMAFILKMSENNKNHIPPTSSYQIILNMFPFQSKIHSFGISVTTETRIRMRRYQKQFEIRYLEWCHLKILKRIASGCKT